MDRIHAACFISHGGAGGGSLQDGKTAGVSGTFEPNAGKGKRDIRK
jgi:hypothetical protein